MTGSITQKWTCPQCETEGALVNLHLIPGSGIRCANCGTALGGVTASDFKIDPPGVGRLVPEIPKGPQVRNVPLDAAIRDMRVAREGGNAELVVLARDATSGSDYGFKVVFALNRETLGGALRKLAHTCKSLLRNGGDV